MVTDALVALITLFLLWRGSSRGILQSLIGPLAFIVASFGAYLYYKSTGNILISLSIGIIGPMILYWLLLLIIRMIASMVGGKTEPNILSRIAGAFVTTMWGLIIIVPIIIMLSFLPNLHPTIKTITTDIKISNAYTAVKPFFKLLKLPHEQPAQTATGSVRKDKVITTNALEEIQNDKHMQELINDPAIKQAIEDKNYAALLSNPKIMQMAQNPEFVKKLMSAYSQMQEQPIVPAATNSTIETETN